VLTGVTVLQKRQWNGGMRTLVSLLESYASAYEPRARHVVITSHFTYANDKTIVLLPPLPLLSLEITQMHGFRAEEGVYGRKWKKYSPSVNGRNSCLLSSMHKIGRKDWSYGVLVRDSDKNWDFSTWVVRVIVTVMRI